MPLDPERIQRLEPLILSHDLVPGYTGSGSSRAARTASSLRERNFGLGSTFSVMA